jgi:hypothetical protein
VNLKQTLSDVTWQQAVKKLDSFNTIATLTYHIHYFIDVASKVLAGGALEGNDALSFSHPPVQSQEDWEQFLDKTWADAEKFALLIEQLPQERLWEAFTDDKYGTYYRNVQGIIEHTHYHLGQIVILKKILN